jgi:hypothetical protein
MFQQMASPRKDKPVFWDYHVILLSTTTTATTTAGNNSYTQSECRVWDVDSYLSLPCSLEDYIQNVFPNYAQWPQEYAPYFRVVDAFTYLQHFSSDRMHMYDQRTKRWSATPPTYDCIIVMRRQHNVNRAPKQQQGKKHGESSENGSNWKNNTDATKTGFTAASNLKQYMTISDDDVRCRRRNGNGDHRHNGDNEEDSSSSSSQMYGKIYSLSELLERFAGAAVPPPWGRS